MREFTHKDVSIPKTLKSSSKLDTVSLTSRLTVAGIV